MGRKVPGTFAVQWCQARFEGAGERAERYAAGMISQFGSNTALLLIDVQVGVDVLEHWGGPTGRRNNPAAEAVMGNVVFAARIL